MSSMLPSHLTDTISVDTVVTEPGTRLTPQKLSLQQETGLEMDTENRNPSGVCGTMEDTLIVFLI